MFRLPLAVLMMAAIALSTPLPATAQTTHEMAIELSNKVTAVDRKLNKTYKELSAALSPKAKQALTRAELAWLKFREAEVKAEADEYRGGTFQPIRALHVDLRLLEQRSHELERWLIQVSNYDEPWPPKTVVKVIAEQKGVYAQADHLLNQAYKEYMGFHDAENHKLMTQAELAWITFRDREAEFAAVLAPRKDLATYARLATLAELTGQRAQDLGEIVKELKDRAD